MKGELKKSHSQLQSLVDEHNELGKHKPLLLGKKAWEEQREEIQQKYRQLKKHHEQQKEYGVDKLMRREDFREYAGKQYKQQHPEKAEQYQKLYGSYQTIKSCVDQLKEQQCLELKQAQLKEQANTPKMKYRGMSL